MDFTQSRLFFLLALPLPPLELAFMGSSAVRKARQELDRLTMPGQLSWVKTAGWGFQIVLRSKGKSRLPVPPALACTNP